MRLIKKIRQDKEEERCKLKENLFQCNLEDLNYEINRKIRRKRLFFFIQIFSCFCNTCGLNTGFENRASYLVPCD